MATTIPAPARAALEVWLQHHDDHAPGFIEGLYLVGSIALGNWQPDSDIDFIAVSSTPATGDTIDALRSAHEDAKADVGGIDIDGPYVTWVDLQKVPEPLVRPWTLHGDFHHDDGCFEMNPVIWLTLAEHGVAVRGPQPDAVEIAVDHNRVRAFIADNTSSYWRSVGPSIRRALDDPDRTEFDSALTSWCVLGVARMLYTARTGGVTSKSGAGRWISDEFPQHRRLVQHALAVRERTESSPDGRDTAQATADYLDHICDHIAQATS